LSKNHGNVRNEDFDQESEENESKKFNRQSTKSIALIMKYKVHE